MSEGSAMKRAAASSAVKQKVRCPIIEEAIIGKFRCLDKVESHGLRCRHGTTLAPAIRGGGSCHPLLSGHPPAPILDCLGQAVPYPHGAGVFRPADLLPPAQCPDGPVCTGLGPPRGPQRRR